MLDERRQAIVGLLANTSALSRNLTGLVAENEQELAPALEKMNAVNQMLEKNRDNIAKALPGLRKYELTQGEIVANGAYYNALVPNIQPAQLLQPFLDYAFGFRRRRQRRAAAGHGRTARRTSVPRQRDSATRRSPR